MTRVRMGLLALVGFGLVGCGLATWALNLPTVLNAMRLILTEESDADLSTPEGFDAWLVKHRGDVGLVVATVRSDGSVDADLAWNAELARPLASAVKVVHLTAYALDVEAGRVDPNKKISASVWRSFYVPGTDGGAHDRALARLGLGPDDDATIDQVASAMITESDNSAADVLLDVLGQDSMDRARTLFVEGGRIEVDPIHPLLGMMLATEDPSVCTLASTDRWAAMDATAAAYRATPRVAVLPGIEGQRERLDCVSAHATPRAFAHLYGLIVSGVGLPPGAVGVLRRHLEWPMQYESNQADFERFGAKGGAVPGIVTDAFYVVPKQGSYAGQGRVVVLFLQHMSFTAWFQEMAKPAHQVLMVELAQDPARVAALKTSLETR